MTESWICYIKILFCVVDRNRESTKEQSSGEEDSDDDDKDDDCFVTKCEPAKPESPQRTQNSLEKPAPGIKYSKTIPSSSKVIEDRSSNSKPTNNNETSSNCREKTRDGNDSVERQTKEPTSKATGSTGGRLNLKTLLMEKDHVARSLKSNQVIPT